MTGIEEKKIFSNKKFYGQDFRGRDLSHADFRGSTLVECNFEGVDLSYALVESANCYRSNFGQAKLYHTSFRDTVLAETVMDPRDLFGMTLTMTCDTFDRMVIGERWVVSWLYLLLMTKLPDELRQKLVAIIGESRVAALDRLFQARQI